MGLINWIRNSFSATSTEQATLQRPSAWMFNTFGFGKNTSGENVTPQTSMQLSAYYSSIRNISEDLGKLPVSIKRTDRDGNKTDAAPVIWRLLNIQPNTDMSAMTFKEVIVSHALGWGNGYAQIQKNGRGEVMALHLIHPSRVKVLRNGNGFVEYRVYPGTVEGINQEYEVYSPDEIFHLKGLGGDGLVGYSVARFAAESLGGALAAQTFGSAFFGNGAMHGGLLMHPNTLTEQAQKNLLKTWQARNKGAKNAMKVNVLEEGMKWQSTTIPPKDAQFIEVRQFHVIEVARWFRMPPHKLQEMGRATYNNIEAGNTDYVTDCLLSWFVRFEQEVNLKLLGQPTIAAKFKANALLRGDINTRTAHYKQMWSIGVYTPNEIRQFEDLNSYEGGDSYYIPLNMTTTDAEPEEVTAIPAAPSEAEGGQDTTPAGAFDVTPIVKATIERINSKEEKAVARATKKFDAQSLIDWAEDFYAKQLGYCLESIDPIFDAIDKDITAELQEKLAAYYDARKSNIGEKIDARHLENIITTEAKNNG